MAVPVDASSTSTFKFGNATKLFSGPYFATLSGVTYDVFPDGQRFLMIRESASNSDTAPARLTVVNGWL